jgi:hypothetical protein
MTAHANANANRTATAAMKIMELTHDFLANRTHGNSRNENAEFSHDSVALLACLNKKKRPGSNSNTQKAQHTTYNRSVEIAAVKTRNFHTTRVNMRCDLQKNRPAPNPAQTKVHTQMLGQK